MEGLKDLITFNNEEFVYNNWIEWEHYLIFNKPEWLREIVRNLMAFLNHCLTCTALDGCYFVMRNMPNRPLHKNCDCKIKEISVQVVRNNSFAECDIRKFTEYIFNTEKSKGKEQIFNNLGYTKNDSELLQRVFCQQALEQYLNGNYKLRQLDKMGQRLAIVINLNGTKFFSGWMLYPEGKIKNTTPFGGWVNEKI